METARLQARGIPTPVTTAIAVGLRRGFYEQKLEIACLRRDVPRSRNLHNFLLQTIPLWKRLPIYRSIIFGMLYRIILYMSIFLVFTSRVRFISLLLIEDSWVSRDFTIL